MHFCGSKVYFIWVQWGNNEQFFCLCLFIACRKIDISTATFTYDVENLPKHQFEIVCDGKSSSLQASNKEVMIYWLTSLQVGAVCTCALERGTRERGGVLGGSERSGRERRRVVEERAWREEEGVGRRGKERRGEERYRKGEEGEKRSGEEGG